MIGSDAAVRVAQWLVVTRIPTAQPFVDETLIVSLPELVAVKWAPWAKE